MSVTHRNATNLCRLTLKTSLHNHSSPRSKHPLTSQLVKCYSLKGLQSIHATIIKTNSIQDPFSMNQFLTACSRLRQIDYALLTFAHIIDPNIFVYNALIAGFIRCSSPMKALQLYVEMPRSRLRPTRHTFSYLVKACTQLVAVRLGETVHGQIRKTGFASELVLQTGLIELYLSSHKTDELRRVFDEMDERDAFSWNTMIFAHTCLGDMEQARRLFDEMPERNAVSWNAMIAGYTRSGDVESAAELFDRMPDKNLVSWTSMIACYSQNKQFKQAVEAFEEMKAAGVSPDEVTMATVISACAHLGALEVGRRVHHEAMLLGIKLDVYIGSALIDMYAKCGDLERSLVVFFKLEEKNLFCWNSVIDGLAVHGRAREALDMLDRMRNEGWIKPNGVSFVSVLRACAHAGLVEVGRRMFASMIRDYSIAPEMEHYCCMVDLLGRAGLLDEALDLIQSMKMKPNAAVWGALLAGCKIHGNLEIGKVAVESLMALEPDRSSNYVLLVNMYAEASRWAEVAAVRGMMRERGVQKRNPGCSWIEMDGIVHEFAAADLSHPSSDEVCLLLTGLDGQLKLAGYTPETEFQ